MATLHTIASGSSGNSYILTASNGEQIIIECGIGSKYIRKALDYDLSNVKGILISHIHSDHLKRKTADQLRRYRIPMYGTMQCKDAYPWFIGVESKTSFNVGGFTVMALAVPHGNTECNAYVIDLPNDEGRLLFATDCTAFPYSISDVNYIMIEANYDENITREVLLSRNDIWNASETHMEIDTTLDVIKRHLNAFLKKVVLIHLSQQFSDKRAFVEAVDGMMVDCVAANAGQTVTFSQVPF